MKEKKRKERNTLRKKRRKISQKEISDEEMKVRRRRTARGNEESRKLKVAGEEWRKWRNHGWKEADKENT